MRKMVMNNMNNPEQLSLHFAAKQHQQAWAKIHNYFWKIIGNVVRKKNLDHKFSVSPSSEVPRMAIRTSMGSFN